MGGEGLGGGLGGGGGGGWGSLKVITYCGCVFFCFIVSIVTYLASDQNPSGK